MDAKTWLSRGIWMQQEKEQIAEMREEMFERLTNITQELSGVNVSSTKDPHKYDALIELDSKLEDKEKQIDRALLEIYTVIQELEDSRFRTILLARYVECKSWKEIQARMHYYERHVYRLHGLALQKIAPLIAKRIEKDREEDGIE